MFFLKLIKSRPRRKCKIINSNHCCCFLSEVKFELKCFYEIFPQMPSCRITRPKGELISQKSGRRFTFLTKSHRRPIDCRPTNARTLIYMPAGKFVCKHCHQACRYNLGIDRRFYSSRWAGWNWDPLIMRLPCKSARRTVPHRVRPYIPLRPIDSLVNPLMPTWGLKHSTALSWILLPTTR